MRQNVPIIGVAAYSGTGKTTLLRRLLPILKDRGIRVAVVKHAHHDFDIDYPGKDSYELRKAGADQVLVGSAQRWALIVEQPMPEKPELDVLLERLVDTSLDLILVEGFKPDFFPKIELHRPALKRPLMFPEDHSIVAVATDAPLGGPCSLPVLDLNDPAEIADFIIERCLPTSEAPQVDNPVT